MPFSLDEMLNNIRHCEGYTGNPSLFDRCHWVETGSQTWSYCPKIRRKGKDLPVGLVFPAIVDPIRKSVTNMGNWKPTYASDPEKAKWALRFTCPSEPQLALPFGTNIEFFKKVQKAIEEKSPGRTNYAADDKSVKAAAFMFEKRTADPSKFETEERIKMPLPHIEANWDLDPEYQAPWNKVMTTSRLLPLIIWKDNMKTMAHPDEYADILPGALAEVHVGLTFHAWGKEGNFAAKIEQLMLWRHGSPAEENMSAYGSAPLLKGPVRVAAKRSIEEMAEPDKADKAKKPPTSKKVVHSVKITPKPIKNAERPVKKLPTKSSKAREERRSPEQETNSGEDVIAEADDAKASDEENVQYEEEGSDKNGGSEGSDSWSGISTRESSLVYTEDEQDAEEAVLVDMEHDQELVDDEHVEDVEEDAVGDPAEDEEEPAQADEETNESPEEEAFHPPMSPAKRQKRVLAPRTPKKKSGNASVPTTPISRLRLSSNSPKEASPTKRSVTRSATAAKATPKRQLPDRSAKKASPKA